MRRAWGSASGGYGYRHNVTYTKRDLRGKAAMALSPWPTTPVALTNATARLRTEIGPALPFKRPDGTPDTEREAELSARLQRLGAVAAALVEREAPGAPEAVKDEAVIRFAGYMSGGQWGTLSKSTLGPQSAEYVTNHAPMFRNCGAKSLLGPWKVRRAGAIG